MAKNRNKGFAVIEIVIAIAILTLLLTPIVNQLAQTMSTNRKAKEQQYAIENAQYVMEYFQNNSLDVLQNTTDTSKEIYPTEEVKEVSYPCAIYEIDGDTISNSPVGTITYSVSRYKLNSVELGSRKAEYNRTVELNDLAIQLMSTPITVGMDDYSYRVAYDMSEHASFELTDDGSLVQYSIDASDPSNPVEYVSAIVCRKYGLFSAAGIDNPNTVNLGNMHNLDSTQVAMITGYSTDHDEQAEKQFYSLAMERLKEINEEWWEDELRKDTPGIRLYQYGYIEGLKKMTEIKIDEGSDLDGSYYSVDVNVYYENININSPSDSDKLKYNVYSQKFYYDPSQAHSCPDVYFEYQPFAVSSVLGDELEYSAEEYILIDNNVEGAKIYLYKPKWDQAYRYMHPTADYTDGDLIMASSDTYYVKNFQDDLDHTINTDKVNIHINNANNPVLTDTFKNTYIYTNLLYDDGGVLKVDVNGADSQFITDNTDIYNTYFKVKNGDVYTSRSAYDFDPAYLLGIDDENNIDARLFSIKVYLEPVDKTLNTIELDGAKGVD